MNVLSGQIVEISVSGNLSMVTVDLKAQQWQVIVIDTPETSHYLQPEHSIKLLFKETEVILAKAGTRGLSLTNQIAGKINAIEKGPLLCKVELSTELGLIRAVVPTAGLDPLDFKKGDSAIALVKTNEIMLSE